MTIAERVAAAAGALRAGYRDLDSRVGVARQRRLVELEGCRERLAGMVETAYRLGELSDAEYDAVRGILA